MAKKIYGKDDTGYSIVGELSNDIELVDVPQKKDVPKAKKGAKNEESVKAKKKKSKVVKDEDASEGSGSACGAGFGKKKAKRKRLMASEGYLTDIDIVDDEKDPDVESKKKAVITKSADDTATTKKKKKKQA
jgi:hypothetical protein